MLQRIQTIWLLLVAILSFAALFCPLLSFYQGVEVVATISNWTFSVADNAQLAGQGSMAPMAMGLLLIVVILITLMSIMLFRFRMRQLRLTIFSTLLLLGYVGVYAFLVFKFSMNLDAAGLTDHSMTLHVASIFPIISIILNFLAIHGIRKDERLVRSLDRIR